MGHHPEYMGAYVSVSRRLPVALLSLFWTLANRVRDKGALDDIQGHYQNSPTRWELSLPPLAALCCSVLWGCSDVPIEL